MLPLTGAPSFQTHRMSQDALVGHMGNRVTKAELESKLQALEGDNSLAQRLAALEGSLEHLKGNQVCAQSHTSQQT